MNLLLLKNKRIKVLLILTSLLLCSFKSIEIIKNGDPFLELCKNSDAYYEHSYTDITYQKNWSGYTRYVSIDNKKVINTSLGVEKYAFLTLNEFVSNNLESIQIKTLKADGSVVELDSSLVFNKKSKLNKFGAINYPIPSVEPGDTIETKFVYYERLDKSNLMEYVNLTSDLNSLNSQYTVKTSPDFIARYKCYNGFPEPGIISNDSLLYLQFSIDKIKGVSENEYNCLPCEKPYLYYSLDEKGSELRSWKDIYNEEFNLLTQPMALDLEKSSYYKRWKRNVISNAKDSSKYYKLSLLHKEVLNNFDVESIYSDELIKSSGYFLKEKRFNMSSIRRFYRQILEDLEIDYWAVFGKSKSNGPIDNEYIRKGEFDHIFFAFNNENGSMQFLYPHDEYYMYQIDELPTSLFNTKAIIVKPVVTKKSRKKDRFIDEDFKFNEVDSVDIAEIILPGMDSKFNYINQVISSEVNIQEKKANLRSRFKVSGGLFTELNSFYEILNKDKRMSNFYDALLEVENKDSAVQIDTIIKRTLNSNKPFTMDISAKGRLNNTITFINDSTVSVSFDNLINHNQIEYYNNSSDLNYYLDFSYSDLLIFYLNFPKNIEIIGLENSSIVFKNDFGEYNFELRKNKDNQLQLRSNYKILKDQIQKENLHELYLLNEKVNNAKNKRVIIKIKQN